jgi:Zn-finger protein
MILLTRLRSGHNARRQNTANVTSSFRCIQLHSKNRRDVANLGYVQKQNKEIKEEKKKRKKKEEMKNKATTSGTAVASNCSPVMTKQINK